MKDLLDKGAVIQRDMETYAIAPHLTGGLITPKQLRDIADVAEKYNASAVKVTGAQRIAIVGLKEECNSSLFRGNGTGYYPYGELPDALDAYEGDESNRWNTD